MVNGLKEDSLKGSWMTGISSGVKKRDAPGESVSLHFSGRDVRGERDAPGEPTLSRFSALGDSDVLEKRAMFRIR